MPHLSARNSKNVRAFRRHFANLSQASKRKRTYHFIVQRLKADPAIVLYLKDTRLALSSVSLQLWVDVKDTLSHSQGILPVIERFDDPEEDIIRFRDAVRTHHTSQFLTRLCGYDWYSLVQAQELTDRTRRGVYRLTRFFNMYNLVGLRVSRPHA